MGLRVGELARRTGVGVSTLRAWEARFGFLRPERSPAGHRLYSEEDVERVSAVVRLVAEGMTLAAAITRVMGSGPRVLPDGEGEARLFGQILDAADVGIWFVRDWRTRYANHHLAALMGHTQESFLNARVQDLIHPESLQTVREARELVMRGQPQSLTARFCRADGSTFLATIRGTPIMGPDGHYDGVVLVLTGTEAT